MSPLPPDPARRGESRWPATAAVLVAIALYVLLPERLTPGPHWVVPVLEIALVVALTIANPSRLGPESRDMRAVSLAMIALVNAANVFTLARLIQLLLTGHKTTGRDLLPAGAGIWVTLIIVFGLWYWELDRGGPYARSTGASSDPDFFFTQMGSPELSSKPWAPHFVDYLYVSLTNSTAFSPTDTLPLTRRAKAIMGIQGVASLATVALVAARAVNILS